MKTKTYIILMGFAILGIIFIGVRFLVAPETGEIGYGVNVSDSGNYAFHQAKGIRDVFMGLVFLLLVIYRQKHILGLGLIIGSIVPFADMWIVLSQNGGLAGAWIHIAAIIFCFSLGITLILDKKPKR